MSTIQSVGLRFLGQYLSIAFINNGLDLDLFASHDVVVVAMRMVMVIVILRCARVCEDAVLRVSICVVDVSGYDVVMMDGMGRNNAPSLSIPLSLFSLSQHSLSVFAVCLLFTRPIFRL